MSDEAKSNEIDEVMSSVRKLVNQAAQDDDSVVERLLLTPADRIDETQAAPQELPVEKSNVLILDTSRNADPAVVEIAREAETLAAAADEAATSDDESGLEATIAQLETALSTEPVEEEWVPDEADQFDEADWVISASADDGGAAPEPDAADEEPVLPTDEPVDPAAELAAFFQGDMPRDREALKELIVQVLREELSGDTGERITRNVRKLIRREVKQIVAARDI